MVSVVFESELAEWEGTIGTKHRLKQELSIALVLHLKPEQVRTLRVMESATRGAAANSTPQQLVPQTLVTTDLEVTIPTEIASSRQDAIRYTALRAHLVGSRLEADLGMPLAADVHVAHFSSPPPLPAQPPVPASRAAKDSVGNAEEHSHVRDGEGDNQRAEEKTSATRSAKIAWLMQMAGYVSGGLGVLLCAAWCCSRGWARKDVAKV